MAKLTSGSQNTNTNTNHNHVWYLGYGSNMNPKVLSGRRQVYPKHSVPVRAPGYKLTFQVPGLPYMEPGFGSIDRRLDINDPVLELIALAFSITQDEFTQIRDTEGLSYNVIHIDCIPINELDQAKHGSVVSVVTLMQDKEFRRDNTLPSRRYMNLLIQGANHHDLPMEYQSWLQTIPCFEVSRPGQHIGRLLIGGVVMPMFLTSILIRNAWKWITGRKVNSQPPGLRSALDCYFSVVWTIYWYGMRPILGDGGSGQYALSPSVSQT